MATKMFKKDKLDEIRDKEKAWEKRVLSDFLAKLPERKKEFTTSSGIHG